MNSTREVALASQPWGTKFLNALYLFSPRTWLGALQFQASSPFRSLDLPGLFQGLLGVIVPAIVLGILSNVTGRHLLIACALSPWTVSSIQSITAPLAVFASNMQAWKEFRTMTASRDVLIKFQDRIDQHRAIRYRRYDVFLPREYNGRAIIFFPGAFMDHTDYSEIAGTLSDFGLAIVVVSVEPLRLASRSLGADPGRVQRIMKQVDQRHLAYPADWSLGGHSLGSFAAMRLALSLQPSGLVMWGSAFFPMSMTNISANTNTRALVIQGSNDKMCIMHETELEIFMTNLPPSSTIHIIEGASHNQFGSYSGKPHFDGVPRISKQEQHRQTCEVTANFLLQV
jgi:pimeloyl-ACP methyl ester carboxylesterase